MLQPKIVADAASRTVIGQGEFASRPKDTKNRKGENSRGLSLDVNFNGAEAKLASVDSRLESSHDDSIKF